MKLYRVMKVDADGKPRVGTRRSMLGVRPTDPTSKDPRRRSDVAAVSDGDAVTPGEGMSTSLTPGNQTAGPGEAVFEIETDDLPVTLRPNPDHPPHCLIEPSVPLSLADFQAELADTIDLWQAVD